MIMSTIIIIIKVITTTIWLVHLVSDNVWRSSSNTIYIHKEIESHDFRHGICYRSALNIWGKNTNKESRSIERRVNNKQAKTGSRGSPCKNETVVVV